MNPTDKYRLIQDIYFSLQTRHNAEGIINILNEYGIDSIPTKTYNQDSIKKLLQQTENTKIIKIADDLNLVIPPTKTNKGTTHKKEQKPLQKVFISHSHHDKKIVESFVLLLQNIGIPSENIFCSSLEGYGTPLGKDFINDIKSQLNEDVLVFFMLSEHFYKSPMCLIELGAVWIQTKEHISVTIPPFEFKQMKGVFQHFKGMTIDDEKNLDMLKETLESKFNIPHQSSLVWSPKREMSMRNIKYLLPTNNDV
ncbi:toll/interleukin-1 receptor domain-containing protein [Tenacibaculum sp. M341]|uniref:toll/interleukin-1 receptor domain-containing protein n=1 Tax=Tenacibaculum sp. M341 TaxID=2530339 RepID=UPI00104AA7DC|nr:toll/interleukin-1 receptor domain-containing protein [Tenacibaculum sp. M341]TCI95091.1 TIR domain-containing protein [Tenacibaculum sp. M341]